MTGFNPPRFVSFLRLRIARVERISASIMRRIVRCHHAAQYGYRLLASYGSQFTALVIRYVSSPLAAAIYKPERQAAAVCARDSKANCPYSAFTAKNSNMSSL